MWRCSVCEKEHTSGSVCDQCGFVISTDYEQYRTLFPSLPEDAKPIFIRRTEWGQSRPSAPRQAFTPPNEIPEPPAHSDTRTEPEEGAAASGSYGTVEIKRVRTKPGERDASIAYKVFIDYREVTSIKIGEIKMIRLSPGTHSIFFKMGLFQSKSLFFPIKAGEVTCVRCSAKGSEANGLLPLFQKIKESNDYMNVEIVESFS